MFCSNCGTKIDEGNSFCTNCGTHIEENVVNQNINTDNKIKEMTEEDKKRANLLSTLSLVCGFLAPGILSALAYLLVDYIEGLSSIIYSLVSIASTAGLVLMIIVRVKYPKSVFGKVVMWIYIVSYILAIIAVVLLIIACVSCLSQCKGY